MSPLPAGPTSIPVPSLALVILDGWGLAPDGPGNAISQASTPVFDELWSTYPHATLSTSGRDVGLPAGQMGNSEVGHLNLGAGAVVKQDLARIDDAIADGSFFENPALRAACGTARDSRRGRLHAIGLISDGGVHSGWEHIEAVIELAGGGGGLGPGPPRPHRRARHPAHLGRRLRRGGRALAAPRRLASGRSAGATGEWIATGAGTAPSAPTTRSSTRGRRGPRAPWRAIRDSYEREVTDEFIEPTVIGDYDGAEPDEPFIFINFRPDRARQLTRALGEPDFDEFDRGGAGPFEVTTMTEYQHGWPYPVAFPPREPATTLAQVIAEEGERQLHVAETEKYAHVTYFFNGGREEEWSGEERYLVDSPRDVPTYDHKPQMSAAAAAKAFSEHWREDGYRFGIINFANPDMVGHTGVIPAAVAAVEEVDDAPRGGGRGRPREGRGADRHRRPRQLRADARARRLARTPPTRPIPSP